jgi:hypothetical protein
VALVVVGAAILGWLFLSGSSASGTPTGKPGTPPVKPGTPPAPPQVLKGSRVLLVGDSLWR